MKPIRLSVVTITCRENGRLADMAKAIAGSLAQHVGRNQRVELEWIVIPEHVPHDLPDDLGPETTIIVKSPPVSPHRATHDKRPAHNTARNAGLALATGQYVVFLDDCAIVTRNWIELLVDVTKRSLGLMCRTYGMADVKIPADGAVIHRDHNDRLRAVPAQSIAGACWGAPKAAFEAVEGFDTAFDGDEKFHDTECAIRLARSGVQFVTSERANVLTLKRTKHKSHVTTNREALLGAKNKKLFSELQKDRTRVLPTSMVGYLPVVDGDQEDVLTPEPHAYAAPARVAPPRNDAAARQARLVSYKDLHKRLRALADEGRAQEDDEVRAIASEMEGLWEILQPNQRKIVQRDLGDAIVWDGCSLFSPIDGDEIDATDVGPAGGPLVPNGTELADPADHREALLRDILPPGDAAFDHGDIDTPVTS